MASNPCKNKRPQYYLQNFRIPIPCRELIPQRDTPLMGELHELIDNTVRLHQGIINRYTGDTFLAVFYLNKIGHSASINAVDTAFELKDQLDSFIREKKLASTFVIKISVATGTILFFCAIISRGLHFLYDLQKTLSLGF